MKVRDGFVTNSSSTVFVIRNKTDKNLTAVDFAREIYPLLNKEELIEYEMFKYATTLEDIMEVAKEDNFTIPAKKMMPTILYDDRQGVFKLISVLNNEGETESFEWIRESE
jgi:hypothetical protein